DRQGEFWSVGDQWTADWVPLRILELGFCQRLVTSPHYRVPTQHETWAFTRGDRHTRADRHSGDDRNGHRRRGRDQPIVGYGKREAVRTQVAWIRAIFERGWHSRQRTVLRRISDLPEQGITVDVHAPQDHRLGRVCQYIEGKRRRHRRIVDRCDIHGDGRRRRVGLPVRQHIGEAIGTVVVGERQVGSIQPESAYHAMSGRINQRERQSGLFRIRSIEGEVEPYVLLARKAKGSSRG